MKNEKGFTLIETMIAMGLLAFGLLAMGALTTGVMKGNLHNRSVAAATVLGQDRIEQLINCKYDLVPEGNDIALPGESEPPFGFGINADYPLFRRVTDVRVDIPGTKTAIVTVYWSGGNKHATFITILRR